MRFTLIREDGKREDYTGVNNLKAKLKSFHSNCDILNASSQYFEMLGWEVSSSSIQQNKKYDDIHITFDFEEQVIEIQKSPPKN